MPPINPRINPAIGESIIIKINGKPAPTSNNAPIAAVPPKAVNNPKATINPKMRENIDDTTPITKPKDT